MLIMPEGRRSISEIMHTRGSHSSLLDCKIRYCNHANDVPRLGENVPLLRQCSMSLKIRDNSYSLEREVPMICDRLPDKFWADLLLY